MTTLLDPTGELNPVQRELLPRPTSLEGLTIGLLDISKPRGDIFLNRLEEQLKEIEPSIRINRYKKPTFTRPAPTTLSQQIAQECDVVVEALAD